MVKQMTEGDLHPTLSITISDTRADANFAPVQASQCRIKGVQNGVVVFNSQPDNVSASGDGKSLTLRRDWVAGDTDTPGHMWLSVVVDWVTSEPQTFPDEGPLRLDISRRSGSA